jgi:hypothetical protein
MRHRFFSFIVKKNVLRITDEKETMVVYWNDGDGNSLLSD